MKINIIGCGYVGLTCAAFLSHHAQVVCSDTDVQRVKKLQNGSFECAEPFIIDFIKSNKVSFSHNYAKGQDIYLICVGTPDKDGVPDTSQLDSVIAQLQKSISSKSIIILKSTILPGMTSRFTQSFNNPVYFIPEFLSEGTAYEDYMFAEKIVIGGFDSDKEHPNLKKFLSFHDCKNIVYTNYQTAELSKYANNVMLASRVATLNQISLVADSVGANMKTIETLLGMDSRIGPKYLKSGLGFGGSCLEKDLYALKYLTSQTRKRNIFQSIIESNDYQTEYFAYKIHKKLQSYGVNSYDNRIIVSGLTFKDNTDDCRNSRAILLVNYLIALGYFVYLEDVILQEEGIKEKVLVTDPERVSIITSIDLALPLSCALIVCQKHSRTFDYVDIHNLLLYPIIGDPNKLLDKEQIIENDLQYVSIGS